METNEDNFSQIRGFFWVQSSWNWGFFVGLARFGDFDFFSFPF